MRLILIIMVAMLPSLALAWPWSTDMMNQPSIKPQEGPMRVFPQRSIPVQGIPTKVSSREEAKGLHNPIPPTPASIKKGKTLFRIICSACHGLTGKADSPVSPKIGAISLVDSYVQETLTEGWIFGTITFGSYVMPAYGIPSDKPGSNGKRLGSNDLTVEERWDVVNYVRHQLAKDSQQTTVAGN